MPTERIRARRIDALVSILEMHLREECDSENHNWARSLFQGTTRLSLLHAKDLTI